MSISAFKGLGNIAALATCIGLWALVPGCEQAGSSAASDGGSAGSAGNENGGSGGTHSDGGTAGSAGSESGGFAGDAGAAGESGSSGSGANGGDSGSGASGGDSGSGGADTGGSGGDGTVGHIEGITLSAAREMDVLFVVDNSISMADKQAVLRDAVPDFVRRFVDPACVNPADVTDVKPGPGPGLECPAGYRREFRPIVDIHVAIITSSLGGHGGNICGTEESGAEPTKNDRAHVLGSVRGGLSSYNGLGFLAWDPDQKLTPPGEADAAAFTDAFRAMVVSAGESGCGFESTLESWYRFLVDPEPALEVTLVNGQSGPVGVDDILLQQRAAFLRPHSLVSIVMLSDENDCSIIDSGQGWVIASTTLPGRTTPWIMPHGTSQCETDPNDVCCRNCSSADPPNCPAGADDAACLAALADPSYDAANLRCHEQKRRFGIDFLYPTQRYIDGLTQSKVPGRDGQLKPNPLFAGAPGTGDEPRPFGRVFLTGIIGVPWQDLASEASLAGGPLRFMRPEELARAVPNRWDVILGNPTQNILPLDPLMHETSAERTGTHPLLNVPMAPSTSTNPQENPINGHEFLAKDDLQYACIFPLSEPRDCSSLTGGCDCKAASLPRLSPLCNPPAGGAATTTQYFAKAYPAGRLLEVLKGLDEHGIVASICPKETADTQQPDYGYVPAVSATVEELKRALGPGCLADELPSNSAGTTSCKIVETTSLPNDCSAPRRKLADAVTARSARAELERIGACTGAACKDVNVCEILPSDNLQSCLNDEVASGTGYCYVDPANGAGAADLVQHCPASRQRILRFSGADTPRSDTNPFIVCPD